MEEVKIQQVVYLKYEPDEVSSPIFLISVFGKDITKELIYTVL